MDHLLSQALRHFLKPPLTRRQIPQALHLSLNSSHLDSPPQPRRLQGATAAAAVLACIHKRGGQGGGRRKVTERMGMAWDDCGGKRRRGADRTYAAGVCGNGGAYGVPVKRIPY